MDLLDAILSTGVLDAVFAVIPPRYAAIAGVVWLALAGLRTGLYYLERLTHALDTAIDGRVDWHWAGRIGDAARMLDRVLSYTPAKRLFGSDRTFRGAP